MGLKSLYIPKPAIVFFAVFAALPLISSNPYHVRIFTIVVLYASFVYAANIIIGESRQLFLCMSALAGISAYTSSILSISLGINPWLTIPAGILFSAAVGGLLSYVSIVRGLGEIFVAIVTLTFTLIFENVVLGLRWLTMGETGLVTPALWWPFQEIAGKRVAGYYTILIFTLLVTLLYANLVRSRLGVALRAIRSDRVSAEVVGIDVTRYNVIAAAIGSGILALGGAFYGYFIGMISPGIFSPSMDIAIILMLVLGGIRTLYGPLIGSVAIVFVLETTRGLGQLTLTFLGVLLVVLILTFREGISSIIERAATRLSGAGLREG